MTTAIGYHHSHTLIPLGETIFAAQSKNASYLNLYYPIYKSVADELGKYFPLEIGYAYPTRRTDLSFEHIHTVEAKEEFVTLGNANFSVWHAIAQNPIRSLMHLPLEERTAKRNAWIKSMAVQYFDIGSLLEDGSNGQNQIELISDRWIVKGH